MEISKDCGTHGFKALQAVISRPIHTPWVSITERTAKPYCQDSSKTLSISKFAPNAFRGSLLLPRSAQPFKPRNAIHVVSTWPPTCVPCERQEREIWREIRLRRYSATFVGQPSIPSCARMARQISPTSCGPQDTVHRSSASTYRTYA
jgi:hypothetical protein